MALQCFSAFSLPSKRLSRKTILLQLFVVFLIGFFLTTFTPNTKWNMMCTSTAANACPFERNVSHQSQVKESMQQVQQVQPSPPTQRVDYPFTIITGSSANHLCALENFLYALHQLKPTLETSEFPRVAVYDIGMNRTQLPVLDQLQSNGLIDDLVTFDYYKYPPFWDVALNAGEYAWKTGIVNDARQRYGGILIWLDAGNIVTTDFLRNIPSIVREAGGFWSPRSSFSMARWTHPGMFEYFNAKASSYAQKINCNGAAIGFDANNQTIVDTMIRPWYECALVKDCIAPVGSSRKNHRQDQAVLTYLAYLNGYSCRKIPARYYNLQVHRDVSCRANLLELDLQGMLSHPSAIDTPKWERVDTLALYQHPEWRYPIDKVPQHLQTAV